MWRMYLTGIFNKVVVSVLLIATSSLIEMSSQSTEFTIEPGNVSTPLHPVLNVTFRCSLSDPGLRSHWIVRFPDIQQNLSTRNVNNMLNLTERGVVYDSSSITIPGVLENNCTLITCATITFGAASTTEFSDPVKLTVVGPPLPPDPILVPLCASQLEIQWEVPYSPENFTVESYNIVVVNQTSGDVLDNVMHQNETRHGFSPEGIEQVMSCHLLAVSVTAVSVVGESEPGMVRSGFPIAPQPFQSEVNVELTFHRDGTPIVEVSFEAPLICDFQTSNYTVIIEDTGSPLLTRQSTYTGDSRPIVEIFDSGLQANRNYTVAVSVQDKCFVGNVVSNTTKFSTNFEPGVGSSSKGLGLTEIGIYVGIAAGGGILIVILVSVTLVATTRICSRKRRSHTAPGATMDKILNNSNRRDQPNNNPLAGPPVRETTATGQGSVYETINEYQEAKQNSMISQQQQNYQWKLQQLELVKSEREALEDSAYQVMSSASIGDVSDSATVPATSRFTFPQAYPNSPQSPNNPVMAQQSFAAVPNSTDPSYAGYQFTPCPASAAAGSSLSPIREGHYGNDAGVHGQLYPPQRGFPNQAAIMEEPELSMDEGDQDYTFMSQAGTLASQTMTAPYSSCHGDNGHQVSVDATANYLDNAVVQVDKGAREMAHYTSIRSKDSHR